MNVFFAICLVVTAWTLPVTNAKSSFANGIARLGQKFLSRSDPAKMLATSATVTSLYVGATGIWFRSDTIAAINELERGEKEKALQSLQLAIATLSVFDITQGTVRPIASYMINKMIKARGFFTRTFWHFATYQRALPDSLLNAGGSADDVTDVMVPLKEKIKQAFDEEVTEFLRKSQGYEDLVTGLHKAKGWAKAAKWGDVFGGPIFDSAMVVFSGYQLYLAITDETSSPEAKELSIVSSSLGIVSGLVGIASFAVAALATAGSALAAFAGPIGAIIGCLLGLTAILIDFANSVNPHNTIKQQLETLNKLKNDSLNILDTPVNIAKDFLVKGLNTGFDTIYEVNQASLIDFAGARSDEYIPWYGLDKDPILYFNASDPVKREGDYFVNGRNRIYDKSKYENSFFKPKGIQSIGYDFYGMNTSSSSSQDYNAGITVRVNTALLGDYFWQRGVKINTTVDNDDERKQPDNVVVGYMGSLSYPQGEVRVDTGAGDDVLQLTGLIFAKRFESRSSLVANLGSGINTLSLRGMDTSKLKDINLRNRVSTVVGFRFKMFTYPNDLYGMLYIKLDNSQEVHKGTILNINVFYGSPLNDVIEMHENDNAVIKEIRGSNEYIVHVEGDGRRLYSHTIEDDSNEQATISFDLSTISERFTKDNLRFSKEANTIIVYNRRNDGLFHGRIILKRKNGNHGTHFKINIPLTIYSTKWEGNLEELMENEVGTRDGFDKLVAGVPYKYFMEKGLLLNVDAPEKCSFVILELNPPNEETLSGEIMHFLRFIRPNSYVKISDSLMELLKTERYVLSFTKNQRELFFSFEKRHSKDNNVAIFKIKLRVDSHYKMKAIVYGNLGSTNLLFDVSNDQHRELNLYKEWKSLSQRPALSYRFNRNYIANTDKGKSLILGAPTASSTLPKVWKVELGTLTDDSSRISLVVSDSIFASIDIEREGQFKIIFLPRIQRQVWRIDVKKRIGRAWVLIHRVILSGHIELAYEKGIARYHFQSLFPIDHNSRKFNLHKVMKRLPENLETPMSIADTYKC